MSNDFLRVRLAMTGTEPAVTRTLEIPADYSAYELHLAVQVSLGYDDYEPFELVRPGLTVGVEPAYAGAGITHEGHRYRHADEVEAGDLWSAVGQAVDYTYDFSRLWGFRLTLVARFAAEGELPRCTDAREAAPPEDVDSLAAYYGLLIAYADSEIGLHDLAVQILGEEFDPRGPDSEEITENLAALFGEAVEPHGTEREEGDFDWWDASKYDEAMRIRVKRQEIEGQLPPSLGELPAADKQATLLRVLRGGET